MWRSLKRRGRAFQASSRGASALEFAIIAPIFLMLVLGLIQVSLALFTYNTLENAVGAGARHLYFNAGDREGARAVIVSAVAEGYLDPAQLSVTFQALSTPYPRVEITAVYAFTGIGLIIVDDKIDITSVVSVVHTDS